MFFYFQKTLYFIGLIWLFALINLFILDLNYWGIKPRNLEGLLGIPLSVFLHANIYNNPSHILNNSLFLILSMPILFFFYPRTGVSILFQCIFLTGALVWFFGRPYNHIGASGLTFALLLFLLTSSFFRKNLKALLASLFLILSYAIVMLDFFPRNLEDLFFIFKAFLNNIYMGIWTNDPKISWESHLFGAISGIFLAYRFRNLED